MIEQRQLPAEDTFLKLKLKLKKFVLSLVDCGTVVGCGWVGAEEQLP